MLQQLLHCVHCEASCTEAGSPLIYAQKAPDTSFGFQVKSSTMLLVGPDEACLLVKKKGATFGLKSRMPKFEKDLWVGKKRFTT